MNAHFSKIQQSELQKVLYSNSVHTNFELFRLVAHSSTQQNAPTDQFQ